MTSFTDNSIFQPWLREIQRFLQLGSLKRLNYKILTLSMFRFHWMFKRFRNLTLTYIVVFATTTTWVIRSNWSQFHLSSTCNFRDIRFLLILLAYNVDRRASKLVVSNFFTGRVGLKFCWWSGAASFVLYPVCRSICTLCWMIDEIDPWSWQLGWRVIILFRLNFVTFAR